MSYNINLDSAIKKQNDIIDDYFYQKYNEKVSKYNFYCELPIDILELEVVNSDNPAPTFIIKRNHNCECFEGRSVPHSFIIFYKKKDKPILVSELILAFAKHESGNKLNCKHNYIEGYKFINDITIEIILN